MTEKIPRQAAEERERVEKLLETAEIQRVKAVRLGRDMERIKRVNGIAAALNRRLGTR
jgi:hypothetical protein